MAVPGASTTVLSGPELTLPKRQDNNPQAEAKAGLHPFEAGLHLSLTP